MRTCLYVEDNAIQAKVGCNILQKIFGEVVRVDGYEAFLHQYKGYPGKFDCIVSDYNLLSGGKTGADVVKFARASGFVGNIIGLSALEEGCAVSGEGAEAVFREAGVDAFIVKPMSVGKLVAVLPVVVCSSEEQTEKQVLNGAAHVTPVVSEVGDVVSARSCCRIL